MTNYDSDLFDKEVLNQKDPNIPLEVIPKTDERFIYITYDRLGIIDFRILMKMSLDTKVKPVGKDKKSLGE